MNRLQFHQKKKKIIKKHSLCAIQYKIFHWEKLLNFSSFLCFILKLVQGISLIFSVLEIQLQTLLATGKPLL
ncbi:hypothetical protein GDO81_005246 [Engystomops pustulosus]|uniref:Uncharacterized protein n=1 Tax=Engystomops pustulosus TaxID=76066 RepID=A0AAV7CLX8_ENGPU|nr:hypothetical protein GDO81_005246 [Engystomops pustulosus]